MCSSLWKYLINQLPRTKKSHFIGSVTLTSNTPPPLSPSSTQSPKPTHRKNPTVADLPGPFITSRRAGCRDLCGSGYSPIGFHPSHDLPPLTHRHLGPSLAHRACAGQPRTPALCCTNMFEPRGMGHTFPAVAAASEVDAARSSRNSLAFPTWHVVTHKCKHGGRWSVFRLHPRWLMQSPLRAAHGFGVVPPVTERGRGAKCRYHGETITGWSWPFGEKAVSGFAPLKRERTPCFVLIVSGGL